MSNYRMGCIISTIPELIDVLKIAEGKFFEKKGKETTEKETCFYLKFAIGSGTARPTWSRRRRWHVMHHLLQVFMSLRINTISPNNIWIYDTSCGSYIWIDM